MVHAAPYTRRLTVLVAVLGHLALAQADETEAQVQAPAQSSTANSSISSTTGSTTTGTNSSTATGGDTTAAAVTAGVCEARTINYITHTLPQSCLTSSWTSSPAPRHEPTAPPSDGTDTSAPDSEAADAAATTTFMSFEDWKELMLRRAGQDPQEWRSRRPGRPPQAPDGDRHAPDMGNAQLGDEGEISLNFDHYPPAASHEQGSSPSAADTDGGGDANMAAADEALAQGDTNVHRSSKDAGKTCKERFSYSSFDAGATILKTAPGAKNAKAILVENKDTYMLLECAAPSKYVIVELTDDVLVDTLVLANFEFFSSMIRHFRVSVSDRYPVKADKWRDLGTFEARNSRDIQPFLVENPQIWAKYVRIDFLTHYGNEYYCPLSLLRVHGSRMLDSWKDNETGRDEDDASGTAVQAAAAPVPAISTSDKVMRDVASRPPDVTPWHVDANPFAAWAVTCPLASGSQLSHTPMATEQDVADSPSPNYREDPASVAEKQAGQAETASTAGPDSKGSSAASSTPTPPVGSPAAANATGASAAAADETTGDAGERDRGHNATAAASTTTKSSASSTAGKPRSTGASGANAAPPTVQEGPFNAVTKRLQQVEANLTLSLQYVEEQSRHVQEALQRGELQQRAKVTLFLSDLNQTVLAELRTLRDQYDQIWQSTVLALESQAHRAERDMVALTTRLNLLADEVVFQKRMAIVQAVILLSCLFLVIFSRGVPIPSLASDHAANHTPTPGRPGKPAASPPHDDALAYAQLHDDRDDCDDRDDRDDCDHSLSSYERLSPPLTPGRPADSTRIPSRREPRLSHVNSRKPLPSLPEHPSSPHHS